MARVKRYLVDEYPELITEWNDNTDINEHTVGSRFKAQWKCNKDSRHVWEALIKDRVSRNSGCPVCIGIKVITGVNDLATTHPEIAEEYSAENEIPPTMVASGSTKRVIWVCPRDNRHIYETEVREKVRRKIYCPVCSGHKVINGVNDLKTLFPLLAKEYSSNNQLKSNEIYARSRKKVEWICRKNSKHIWNSQIRDRSEGTGCPYCAGKRVFEGENDLATTHPELAAEWSNRNKLFSTEVSAGSSRRVEWICLKNSQHTWKAIISNRAAGDQCPYCANKKILIGYNDLATTHPEIATQWIKSNKKSIYELHASSVTRGKWKCSECGMISDSTVKNRVNYTCPYCSGRKPIIGVSDLATLKSQLINEWNDERRMIEFTVGSHYIAEWKCSAGHIWKAKIYNRTKDNNPTNCPECFNLRSVSLLETAVYEYIVSILADGIVVEQSNRRLIHPYEIDIYIPEKKIAFEFNGIYWHSDEYMMYSRGVTAADYHREKKEKALASGVSLYFIWENDWIENTETVKKGIANILSGQDFDEQLFCKLSVKLKR